MFLLVMEEVDVVFFAVLCFIIKSIIMDTRSKIDEDYSIKLFKALLNCYLYLVTSE